MHDYRILSRLVREVSLMEVLDHENIVHLIETFETADSLYLVMEYVPGVNLDEHLQQRPNRALSENEARKIFRQIVAAVDYCHSRWVVHRDLKVYMQTFPFFNNSVADLNRHPTCCLRQMDKYA